LAPFASLRFSFWAFFRRVIIIADGGGAFSLNSGMPGFNTALTGTEIVAVPAYIKTFWGAGADGVSKPSDGKFAKSSSAAANLHLIFNLALQNLHRHPL
jgi:hypothetical protein